MSDNQNNEEHGMLYGALKAGDDFIEEHVPALKGLFDSLGLTGLAQRNADKAGDTVSDALTSDFMKKYGYAGGLTMLYLSVFKGWDFKFALIVSGIVATLFGKFVDPVISKFFNKASGAAGPAERPAPGDPNFVSQSAQPSTGTPTNLNLGLAQPEPEIR
jgi:hypothetical protein